MHQRNVVAVAEQRCDLLTLGKPQQTVIDEHAGELFADRFVDEYGGHRTVDAAGQSADHAACANLLTDFLDRLVLESAHRPVAGQPCDVADEIADQLGAVRRVINLRMELHRIEFALVVGDDRNRRAGRLRHATEACRQFGDAVAVAHPHLILAALLPDALEQRAVICDLNIGAAEFAVMAGLDLAAELMRHRLLAVADAEHRHTGFEDRLGRQRRVLVEHRCRPAGQDHGLRFHGPEGFLGLLERHDLGINLLLPHPARDELGDLGAEVDDQNLVMHG